MQSTEPSDQAKSSEKGTAAVGRQPALGEPTISQAVAACGNLEVALGQKSRKQ